MKQANKLTAQFCVNVDQETSAQINALADYYQRKPAELLRLLLVPALVNAYASMQRQQHQENQTPPTLARFKQ